MEREGAEKVKVNYRFRVGNQTNRCLINGRIVIKVKKQGYFCAKEK